MARLDMPDIRLLILEFRSAFHQYRPLFQSRVVFFIVHSLALAESLLVALQLAKTKVFHALMRNLDYWRMRTWRKVRHDDESLDAADDGVDSHYCRS